MKNDSRRARVYVAERELCQRGFRGVEFPDTYAIRVYVLQVTSSRWWHTRYPNSLVVDVCPVEYGCPRTLIDESSSIARIFLPRSSYYQLILLHELTHIVVDLDPPHGSMFCRTYLELVRRFMGDEAWRNLRELFILHRVKFILRHGGGNSRIAEFASRGREVLRQIRLSAKGDSKWSLLVR